MQIFQNIRTDIATELSNSEVNTTKASMKSGVRTADPALPVIQSTDTAAISSTASQLALALSGTSPENSRIMEITSSLSSGSYSVDSAVLATSVMDSMLRYTT